MKNLVDSDYQESKDDAGWDARACSFSLTVTKGSGQQVNRHIGSRESPRICACLLGAWDHGSSSCQLYLPHEEGGAILLHLLYAALARTHLEQCTQFGSPPFERDIQRLGNCSAERHMGK